MNKKVKTNKDQLNSYEPMKKLLLKLEDVCPEGHRVKYTEEGDLVEWIPDEDNPGNEWPLILLRNRKAISNAEKEFSDKAWWHRHQVTLYMLKTGQEVLSEEKSPMFEKGKKQARQIEKQYGRKNLGQNDFEIGIIYGKLSALRWMLGEEWDMFD